MDDYFSKEQETVENFLNTGDKPQKYKELQQHVKDFLIKERYNHSISGCMHDVFTRADKNPSAPIKSTKKIALKLYKWRNNPSTEAHLKPSDIHDIAGITAVCYYPSDVRRVQQFIKDNAIQTYFDFGPVREIKPEKNAGYAAFHVMIKGKGKYRGLKGELQLKTVLTQAWGTKTHDLTYKPAADIDERLSRHMEKLSHTLQLLDEQSEILKDLITDAWDLDVRRRRAAQKQMVYEISVESDNKAEAILKYINDNEDLLAVVELEDPLVGQFDELMEDYRDTYGLGRNYCRLLCIFALNRERDDRSDMVLDAFNEWVDQESADESGATPEDIVRIRTQKSVMAMALGAYAEAIDDGQRVVEFYAETDNIAAKVGSTANLAYFLSEACYHRFYDEAVGGGKLDSAGTERCANKALDCLNTLQSLKCPDKLAIQVKDTTGGVLICCGPDEAAVRKGLALCTEARDLGLATNPADNTAIRAFFDLHEKRAFRRILEFSKSG